ncbi:MAG: class I fructose-bisphosphate aldolase [Alphaproteobacteria bacterium]|nr:class I fructose-bisphosphate aldolase [Alphaproteobacteria bacterium]
MNQTIENILSHYSSFAPAIIGNLYKILMHGKLSGTGKLLVLPVDQGFEHGPDRSFAKNPASYDPEYHLKIAIEAGLSAYAAPFGFLSSCSPSLLAQIPTILKINSSNSLTPSKDAPNQAITSSVQDALHLGCCAIGITIYPGSSNAVEMFEEAREIMKEARSYGLISIIWSYPRGSISKEGESSIDVCAYAAHIAALLGAQIIKVKPPTNFIEQQEAKKIFESENIDISTLASRISHLKNSCFGGKRLVLFSGGAAKDEKDLLSEIKELKEGGATGSIIGRNIFQRPREDALRLLDKICNIYRSS